MSIVEGKDHGYSSTSYHAIWWIRNTPPVEMFHARWPLTGRENTSGVFIYEFTSSLNEEEKMYSSVVTCIKSVVSAPIYLASGRLTTWSNLQTTLLLPCCVLSGSLSNWELNLGSCGLNKNNRENLTKEKLPFVKWRQMRKLGFIGWTTACLLAHFL